MTDMAIASSKHTRIDQLDEGEWLHRLLAPAHQRVATHPSPQAIERIRARLLREIVKTPARQAA
jgi:hypothetical protein